MTQELSENEKAVKALEAASRRCARAGITVKGTYTVPTEDGTNTYKIGDNK